MKKKIHSESEMVKAVQELESGVDAETVARDHGISRATLYNWKSKYSGMEVSQVKRLKELEEENRKLKQMCAECHIWLMGKGWVWPCIRWQSSCAPIVRNN